MEKITGAVPVLETPFTADGSRVDEEDLRAVVEAVIRDGARGLMVFGFATEFAELSDAERERLLEVVLETAAGRIPVIPSVTETTAAGAIADAGKYVALGADAVMVLPRFEDDFVATMQAVAREVGDELPLYVQVTSGGAGGPVTAEDLVKLGDSIPNSFAVKAEPVPLGPFITTVHRQSQGHIALYTGNQGIDLYEALDRGAVGVMPGCSMVGVYERIVREFLQGSKDTAFDLYNRLVPYLNAFHGPHELAFEKRILVKRGIFKTPFCRSGGGGGEMDAYTEAYLWKYYDYLREQFPQEIA